MFILGRTAEGSSRVPARTTVNCGRAEVTANRCEPQPGQNLRQVLLPLSAVHTYSLSVPELSRAADGTSTLTVPLAAIRWQSRHQHTRVAIGSAKTRYCTDPHRQRPVISVMDRSLSHAAWARTLPQVLATSSSSALLGGRRPSVLPEK